MTSGGFRSVRYRRRGEHDYNSRWQRVRHDHQQPAVVRIRRGWSAGRGDWRFQKAETRFPLNPGAGVRGIPCPRFLFRRVCHGFYSGRPGTAGRYDSGAFNHPAFRDPALGVPDVRRTGPRAAGHGGRRGKEAGAVIGDIKKSRDCSRPPFSFFD